jgi:crotonobetainyl-CoA:carnitine CoA-transferase CaiB-like acyl-CoA transferase
VEENHLMVELQHDVLGPIRMPASPLLMSDTPPVAPQPPPALGAHGREILLEHGYDDATIDRWMAEGIVTTRERLLARRVEAEAEGGV